MIWQADVPFNDLPLLPPAHDFETKNVLRATITARAAIASLDQAARRMPNPTALINSIPLLEAQASSEIENIVTTTDELFRYAQDPSEFATPETKETLRYRAALFAGLDAVGRRPLSANTAIDICSIIHRRETGVRRLPGTYIGNPVTKSAIYTPPSGEGVIRDKLANWERFIHTAEEGIDPLIVMAIAHYQFEAIHPFEDGNGRTGRILNVLQLVQAGLLQSPILYLSRYIIQNKDDYYRLLLAVTRDEAWEEWILFMLNGLRRTAENTLQKVDQTQVLQSRVREEIRQHTTAGSNSDLLDILFENPYCRIANVMERCAVSRPTATAWLNALVADGVLVDVKVGRDRLFINARFFEILRQDEGLTEQREPTLI
ncbi:Fic family protein [Microbacterium sp. LRZ72]|uniref:Fic family protein n=1 Tax=Microbacterium sp. LRZ72 TaxID=2942481 RepID=UPI0029BCA3CA|nr:Fic family protein [Microbacterium sp. LRZ72]MDX2376056.1 Fic family protein [Microbacterium sp. LRZ72]